MPTLPALSSTPMSNHPHSPPARAPVAAPPHLNQWVALRLTALDAHLAGSEAHAYRVGALAVRFARWVGFSGNGLLALAWAGLLHDIGKLAIPVAWCHPQHPPTPAVQQARHAHPLLGSYAMLAYADLWPGVSGVLSHHERWDGSGYPLGLRGRTIPLSGRILAVANTYDNLTTPTLNRPRWNPPDALAFIAAHAGHQFDPMLVAAFLRAAASTGIVPSPPSPACPWVGGRCRQPIPAGQPRKDMNHGSNLDFPRRAFRPRRPRYPARTPR
ncbi:MAG: HD domain-containing protein [Candidatus Viridilinea halotolerans]|uniref:HD domain-containing protein n=1 Tax=Candidatus Viridilinea halotolerans TaxID=2491704 RepID=A0A426U4A6_9CHLR|nr:MAG: HD domain-containing protein [Candidatus Viridilinea halotolerans]